MAAEPSWIYGEQGERSAQLIQVESSRLTPILLAMTLVAVLVAGMAYVKAEAATERAAYAEERADLAQLEVESFKNVLHAYKLPTTVHLPGESP